MRASEGAERKAERWTDWARHGVPEGSQECRKFQFRADLPGVGSAGCPGASARDRNGGSQSLSVRCRFYPPIVISRVRCWHRRCMIVMAYRSDRPGAEPDFPVSPAGQWQCRESVRRASVFPARVVCAARLNARLR